MAHVRGVKLDSEAEQLVSLPSVRTDPLLPDHALGAVEHRRTDRHRRPDENRRTARSGRARA
jgi:hypothetical protein